MMIDDAAEKLMTEGRLTEAVEHLRASDLSKPHIRMDLICAEILAGHWHAALEGFDCFDFDRRYFEPLLKLLLSRNRKPNFLMDPPKHAVKRWNAMNALYRGEEELALRRFSAAEAATPELKGFVDGEEFLGMRDLDDSIATSYEIGIDTKWYWIPFEQTRYLQLKESMNEVDAIYRPVEFQLIDGRKFEGILPLIYPNSAKAGDDFALAEAVDWRDGGAGTLRGIGAKVFAFEETEVPLKLCGRIEFRRSISLL